MAEEAKANLTELCRLRIKNELEAVSQCLANERLASKDETDRLQLELAEARAMCDELQRSLQRSMAEKGKPGDSGGVRAPMVPDTPLAAGVIRVSFRLSEHARDGTEVLEVATPSTVTGGPDQLRGVEHLHDRSVGQGIMLSPQRDPVVTKSDTTTRGSESQGLTALAQTIIGGKPVFLRGARITLAEVEAFVSQKRTQLRSNVFLLTQLDADIDGNAGAQDCAFEDLGEKTGAMARDLGRGVLPQCVGRNLCGVRGRQIRRISSGVEIAVDKVAGLRTGGVQQCRSIVVIFHSGAVGDE